MYNRYIPQPDGSYRRNRIPDPVRPQPIPPAPPPEEDCPPPEVPSRSAEHSQQKPPRHREDGGVDSFLRHLLPQDFDTGDLIVILLLLLMAGDKQEDRTNALLTLAFYFLM